MLIFTEFWLSGKMSQFKGVLDLSRWFQGSEGVHLSTLDSFHAEKVNYFRSPKPLGTVRMETPL